MNDERRKQLRKPCQLRVPFSLGKLDDQEPKQLLLYGNTTDISASGLSFTSDHPIEPGQVVTFGNRRLAGIVRWRKKLDHSYRFGVKFI
jgi:hypothetical protein